MVNRVIEAKKLKKKRRNRFAVFSGSTVKHLHGDVSKQVIYHTEEGSGDSVRITTRSKTVFVGVESFSKQVINTGRGPDPQRMQQYYNGVNPKSFTTKTLSETFGEIKDPRYAKVWNETPITNRINLVTDVTGRLDLFWHDRIWYFVEVDNIRRTIRRSRDYGSKAFAKNDASHGRIDWVFSIPM